MAKFLLHNGIIGDEIRRLFFYKSFGLEIPVARIISFGSCNFNCPYCKRNGYFRMADGSFVNSVDGLIQDIMKICDDAILKKQIIRLSGGDPVSYPEFAIEIAKYVKNKQGRLSIAHNGSSPEFIRRIQSYIESAAIDLKATPQNIASICGISQAVSEKMYLRSLDIQQILIDRGILVDVRTPIFRITTLDDLLFIANDLIKIRGQCNLFWTLRPYIEVVGCKFSAPEQENVIWMAKEIKKEVSKLSIGIRTKWQDSEFIYLNEITKNQGGL